MANMGGTKAPKEEIYSVEKISYIHFLGNNYCVVSVDKHSFHFNDGQKIKTKKL